VRGKFNNPQTMAQQGALPTKDLNEIKIIDIEITSSS
jgi:hypothetical protein